MCIEVYSADQPIQIPYARELIRFASPFSFTEEYTLLIRNRGLRDLTALTILYPRWVLRFRYGTNIPTARLELVSFVNTGNAGPHPQRGLEIVPTGTGLYRADVPDPNDPLVDLPDLEGPWEFQTPQIGVPAPLYRHPIRCMSTLMHHNLSAWNFNLPHPIPPGEARWYRWQIQFTGPEERLPATCVGPVCFHEIVSPIDVRRTVVESLQSALRDARQSRDITGAEAIEDMLLGFGLLQQRQVDVQYYELILEPGTPTDRFVLSYLPQGDIRVKAESPRVEVVTTSAGTAYEPVYEFKSGSMLLPADPWRDTGFSLRLTMAFNRQYFEPKSQ